LEGKKPSKMARRNGQQIWGKFASLKSGENCAEFVKFVLGMKKEDGKMGGRDGRKTGA
jgi:hypothetical protein